jgi:nucleoside-diphosphate-sugar epimerase
MEPSRKLYTNLIKAFCIQDKNEFSIFGNGKNFIDAMYIEDAVEALFKIATSDKGNKIVDFCMGSPLTINELIHQVANIFGKKDMVLTHKGEAAEYTTFYASPREMEALFGFSPETSLNDGMKKFRDYLMNNRK